MIAAHLVAQKTGSADLLASANSAYVHGMGVILLVCGAAALVAALLAAVFLPATPKTEATATTPDMAPEPADA